MHICIQLHKSQTQKIYAKAIKTGMLELNGMLTLEQMRWELSELLCAFGCNTGKRLTELPSPVLFFI